MKTSDWISLIMLLLAAAKALFDVWFKWKFDRKPSLYSIMVRRSKKRHHSGPEDWRGDG